MDSKTQLKLQAYLDGELRGLRAWRMQRRLASDPEARALAAELETIKRVIAENEPGHAVPESREFYWSKIARQLQQIQSRLPEPGLPARQPAFWPRQLLVPVLATACAALLIGLAVIHFTSRSSYPIGRHEVVVAVADPGAVTYRDHATGVTLVWFSYPAQN